MAVDTRGRIDLIPTCVMAFVYCARCGEKYTELPYHAELDQLSNRPGNSELLWRRWLADLGWTENGTVCLACSKGTD